MGFITAGYDGTVDEVQFAEILHRYSVVGADDFTATTQAGDRIVAISDGVALGPGTRDVATDIPNIQFAVATGTRWDLVVLRRDWQPPGGSSSIEIVQGGSAKGYPGVGTAATDWNRRPGIMDDQPLYLQEVNGTLLGQRVDLRCWASHGGLFAKDAMVKTYLDRAGAEVNVNGATWCLQVDNGVGEWKLTTPPAFAPLVMADAFWGFTGQVTKISNPAGLSTVALTNALRRLGPGFPISTTLIPMINGFVPAGFRPAATYNGWALITDGADVPAGVLWFQITPAGNLRGRLDSGSTTFANNWRVHLSGNWTTP